jgi:hypothetical protein
MTVPDSRRRGQPILQLMKIVLFCAVGCASVVPFFRVANFTASQIPFALGFVAVVVSLVWSLLAFVVVRRGPGRDTLICSFLLLSVSVALGVATWLLFVDTLVNFRNPMVGGRDRTEVPDVLKHVSVILALAFAVAFLGRRVLRRLIAAVWRRRQAPFETSSRSFIPSERLPSP